MPVPFRHLEIQRQKMRHHDLRAACSKFTEHDVVMSPNLVGVILLVFPMAGIEPSCRPQDFVRHLGCCWRMLVLEIAHAHAASDIVCNAVLKQLDVRDFSCFGKEEFYLAFGGEEIPI